MFFSEEPRCMVHALMLPRSLAFLEAQDHLHEMVSYLEKSGIMIGDKQSPDIIVSSVE